MDVTLTNLPGSEARLYLGARGEGEPRERLELPAGAADATAAIADGAATLDIENGIGGVVFCLEDDTVLQARLVMAGYTRTIPVLDELAPDTMASNSGDHVLVIHARGVSWSARLHFGAAGTPEPVRLDEDGNPTTIIKTDLWAPGEQPVWITNAGYKSNVLTFTFT